MNQSTRPPSRLSSIPLMAWAFVILWQAVVYLLCYFWIMPEIFQLLGFEWQETGLRNVVDTTLSLTLLELPTLIVLLILLRQYGNRGGWFRRPYPGMPQTPRLLSDRISSPGAPPPEQKT